MKNSIHQFFAYSTVVAIALVLALSGCGKKGDLEPPDGKQDDFPHQYPDPASL